MTIQGLNIIPTSFDALEPFSGKVYAGALALGEDVGLALNTTDKIRADIERLYGGLSTGPEHGRQQQLKGALAGAAESRATLNQANAELRRVTGAAIDLLKGRYGRKWNQRWADAGFTWGTLTLPTNVEPRAVDLRLHFVANPTHASADQNITAARFDALIDAVHAAQHAASQRKGATRAARLDRNAAKNQLCRRLSNLRQELSQLLSADDQRWYEFGFRRPVDGRIPAVVKEVTLAPGGAGQVLVQWSGARLASNYRVAWQVDGTGAEAVEAGLFTDRAATLSGLPSGKTVVVRVSARNASGESAPAEKRIQVP